MTQVMIFAPVPLLTVTIEHDETGPDVHVHCGGQGVWQARALNALGVHPVLCGAFGAECGPIIRRLVESEGSTVRAVEREGRNGVFVHDRRDNERITVAEQPGDVLTRHELDDLYTLCLTEGLRSEISVLSGPADPTLVEADTYRRLAGDLRANGGTVVVDLCGPLLDACLEGGVDLLKTSHEEMIADGRADSDEPAALIEAMRVLRERGAGTVVVSRAERPALALIDDDVVAVSLPDVQVVDPRGAGDTMTAGITAALAQGAGLREAVRLGAAAGALNVTRHGLGTIKDEAVRELAKRVSLTEP
ncbi:1-phosphofructokinase family hexose kinase [Streptomyces sp. URMC 123]